MSGPRYGRAKNLTLEYESIEILERLAPNSKAQGRLISELLRQEERKRHTMRELRQKMVAVVDAVVAEEVARAID